MITALQMKEMSLLQQVKEHRCWKCLVPLLSCAIRKSLDRRLTSVREEMFEAWARPLL